MKHCILTTTFPGLRQDRIHEVKVYQFSCSILLHKCKIIFQSKQYLLKTVSNLTLFQKFFLNIVWKITKKMSKINKKGWKMPKWYFDQLLGVYSTKTWSKYVTIYSVLQVMSLSLVLLHLCCGSYFTRVRTVYSIFCP